MAVVTFPQARMQSPSWAFILRWTLIPFVLVCGLAVRLRVVLAGPDALVRLVPDDVGYYLVIARHLAHGDGSTFDGLHSTNGYHPLWMALLVPLARALADPWLLLRVVLALCTLLNLLTAGLVAWMAHRLGAQWPIMLAAVALFLLDPRGVVSSLDGLETALTTCLLALCCSLLLAARPQGWSFGLAAGLLFLARTDSICYILPLFVVLAWRVRAWRPVLGAAALTTLCALPWILWCLATTGSPIQSSGQAVPYVLHQSYLLSGHSTLDLARHSVGLVWSFLTGDLWTWIGVPWWLPVAAGVIAVWDRSPALLVLLAGWCGLVAMAVVHAGLRWYPRPYYVDPGLLLTALTVAAAALALDRRLPSLPRLPLWALGVLAGMLLPLAGLDANARTFAAGEYPWQVDMADAGRWAAQLPAGTRLVAFNAGLLSYLSGRPIINLDGVVDSAAYDAIRAHRLAAFVAASGARYYVDYTATMQQAYAPFLGGPLTGHPVRSFARSGLATPDHTLWAMRLN